MPDFNYLKHNDSDFPHLGNVDVFKFDNDLDYGRFDAVQMELQICSVPWDMGEAHIGNRTISGIGNVVYFGSKAERDKWFNAIPDSECYRFTTKFKELHRSLEIDVPIPYDMCAKHNYLVVRYAKFANDDSPVVYEGNDGLREWFWFIREVEFLAPNTTRLHLLDDAFQTWIYDINVSGMILERGHAPMFETTATEFLSNPIDNNEYLLTEDVNFGEASTVKHIDACAFNDGEMYACIATTANPQGAWGTKADNNWKVPSSAFYTQQGQPSVKLFCMEVGNLNQFLTNISVDYPQFKQTVQGVFFASSKLITLGAAFTFANTPCWNVNATRKFIDFCTLSKSQFGYPAKYSEMAKLYTSPYAHIEITDENGNADVVKIEDSTGTFKINAAMNVAWPFITIDAHLDGVGGSAYKNVVFRNITQRGVNVSGQWYDTVRTWNVPVFAVVLDPAREYDYSTHFDRRQRAQENATARDNAYALADTHKTNQDNLADTHKTNQDNLADTHKSNQDDLADTLVDNAELNTSTNELVTNKGNLEGNDLRYTNVQNNNGLATSHKDITNNSATSQIQAAESQAAIAATGGAISAAAGAIGAAASGNPAGAVSALVNGIAGIGTTMASTAVGVALTSAQAQYTCDGIDADTIGTNNMVNANYYMQSTMATYTTGQDGKQNLYIEGVANNNAATMSGNATRDQTTQKTNALNDQTTQKTNATNDKNTQRANALRDYNTAQDGITNDIAQAALRAPFIYGTFESGDTSTTKPMAMFAHVVTQSKSAISRAGDEFARYGYTYDGQWNFNGNWNIGKYFTYWKLRDFWVKNLNVPDMYMDKIRFFLFGGVTVWRKPEYIGNIDLYENFEVV